MSVLVEVTQEDIDRGIAGNCYSCPIALALERRTGLKWSVGIGTAILADYRGKHCDLSAEISVFVESFDHRGEVRPFKFWFPTVPHYAKGDTE